MIIPVIMAGGKGERFWPRSRKSFPKQFLNLTGSDSMLQLTVKRLQKLVPIEQIYIVTGEDYVAVIHEQIPHLPAMNIIVEPVGRNTAPCIGLAAQVVRRRHGNDAVMVVLPSDHLIRQEDIFLNIVSAAVKAAEDAEGPLVTLGITPHQPETAYGYIQVGEAWKELQGMDVCRVQRFVEKPDYQTAVRYLESGQFYWNSGMFVFRASVIMNELARHMPELYSALELIDRAWDTLDYLAVMRQEFAVMKSISIDYGIMEKADHVLVIPGEFGWDDVGSWTSLHQIGGRDDSGNVTRGNVVSVDASNCIVEGNCHERLIAILGLEDVIVVDTEDATLVCALNRAQDVKKILDELKQGRQEKYL